MSNLDVLKAQHQQRINTLVHTTINTPLDRANYMIQLEDALYEIRHLLIDIYEIQQTQEFTRDLWEELE